MVQTVAMVSIDFRISRRLRRAPAAFIVEGGAGSRLTAEGLSSETAAWFASAFLEDTLAAIEQAFVTPRPLPGDLPTILRNNAVFLPRNDHSPADSLTDLIDSAQSHVSANTVYILGSGTPHLPPAFLLEALGHSAADIVLGPLEDGGLYLLGLRPEHASLFTSLPRDAPSAFENAQAIARQAGLRSAVLPRWYRVDTLAGLNRLRWDLGHGIVAAPGTASLLALYDPYKAIGESSGSGVSVGPAVSLPVSEADHRGKIS